MPELQVGHFLLVGAAMFSLGLAIVVVKRNAIAVLCGLEMILNGAALNFVAFNCFSGPKGRLDGQVFTIFIITLAAAEAAVALAIVLNLYNQTESVNVDDARALKE